MIWRFQSKPGVMASAIAQSIRDQHDRWELRPNVAGTCPPDFYRALLRRDDGLDVARVATPRGHLELWVGAADDEADEAAIRLEGASADHVSLAVLEWLDEDKRRKTEALRLRFLTSAQ